MKKIFVLLLTISMLFFLFSCSSEKPIENVTPITSATLGITEGSDESFSVTFYVTTPEKPTNADIYLYGDFNNWIAGDSKYKLKKESDNYYSITFEMTAGKTINFRFNRGTRNSEEADFFGDRIRNRTYRFEFDGDVQYLTIENWLDVN